MTSPARPSYLSRRVLVVDDDPVSLLVLAHQLHRLGCEVTQADNLESAVAAAAVLDVSLVISDFAMPDGTALDLLTQLEGGSKRGPPFVIMTGVVEHAELVIGSGSGVVAHLTKPVTTRALTACLRQVWPGWTPP